MSDIWVIALALPVFFFMGYAMGRSDERHRWHRRMMGRG